MSKLSTVSVKGTCPSDKIMQASIVGGKHSFIIDEPANMGGTDEGIDPLSALLGSLIGCENVIIKLVAKEMNFNVGEIEFEVDGTIDIRGLMGTPDVKTYFDTVTIKVTLETDEPADRIAELKEKTEARCPVFQTLKAADVKLIQKMVTK